MRRVETITDRYEQARRRWATAVRYEVFELIRLPGGSSHAAISAELAELVVEAQDERAARCSLVVDLTSAGRTFLATLRDRRLKHHALVATDGGRARADRKVWQAPGREMIGVALELLAERRIEVADHALAATLETQLGGYSTKAPPKDALADWRPTPSSELAQAAMAAMWWSERRLRPIIEQPPAPRTIPKVERLTFDQAVAWAERSRAG